MSNAKKNQPKSMIYLFSLLFVTPFLYGAQAPEASAGDLERVLQRTADYCEKLKKKVFHFYCEEKIVETVAKSLRYPEERRALKRFLEGYRANQEPSRYEAVRNQRQQREVWLNSEKRIEGKNIYLYDYQIIKEGDRIEEQRTLLKLNGKKITGDIPVLQTLIYSYQNAISPVYLFAREHQDQYDFEILRKEKMMKRDAYVIEVRQKNSQRGVDDEGLLAVAWVDDLDFSIIKFSVYPRAFHGYHYLLRKDKRRRGDIQINDVHVFGEIKNGVRFPTRTEINVSFTEDPPEFIENRHTTPAKIHGARILTRISTLYQYKKYKFFTVDVDNPVFKDLDK